MKWHSVFTIRRPGNKENGGEACSGLVCLSLTLADRNYHNRKKNHMRKQIDWKPNITGEYAFITVCVRSLLFLCSQPYVNIVLSYQKPTCIVFFSQCTSTSFYFSPAPGNFFFGFST